MLKIAIIGATGYVGQHLLEELVLRNHEVTAIARNIPSANSDRKVRWVAGDAEEAEHLAELIRGHDALVTALPFRSTDPQKLLSAVRLAAVPRYLVVGGAGSLIHEDGGRWVDNTEFPDGYRAEATAGADFLEILRQTDDINWTFLSPSADILPGQRSNNFRLGQNSLLRDSSGQSLISLQDYAVALVDEIEKAKHSRSRFTVGY